MTIIYVDSHMHLEHILASETFTNKQLKNSHQCSMFGQFVFFQQTFISKNIPLVR